MRDKRHDGIRNRLETELLTRGEPLWRLVQRVGPLRRRVNRLLVNRAIMKTKTRPYPFSTVAPYTSWDSLTDRTFSSRHLGPVTLPEDRPPTPAEAAELFAREGETRLCPKSTVLFALFAQWFTDGFLRTDPGDPRKNTSNHDIDLCQLYGLNRRETHAIRAGEGGLLKSRRIGDEEFAPFMFEGGVKKPEFEALQPLGVDGLEPEKRDRLFAFANDRGNIQLAYIALSTLFLREHNRLARRLAEANPAWDDERLFQTARNIAIVLLIKVVIEDYINHITPYHFRFVADPTAFKNEPWYRQNWMAVEFNLLYRWHSLVPSKIRLGGRELSIQQTLWNTDAVMEQGLGSLLEEVSRQPAGQIGLFNTDPHPELLGTEVKSLELSRRLGLASYNDYRACCGFPRVTAFDQITGDPRAQQRLRELYGHVDNIDYYVGLFAEDTRPNSVLPGLMGRLVGVDALSQALTNPLLAPNVFNEATFSRLGLRTIAQTGTLSDIVHRNVPPGAKHFISMTRADWVRSG
jgi:prostaglandin-endoperoxide synthase 2